MKYIANVVLISLFGLFLAVGNVSAVQIEGDGLQAYFDSTTWGLHAQNDQMVMPDGWVLTNASGASNMVFYKEDPEGLEFGIYSTAGLEEATVFDGSDTPIAKATVSFDAGDAVVVQYWDAGGLFLAANNYSFTGEAFGFWISDATNKYFSDADRNDVDGDGIFGEEEDIALLAYNADAGSYVFAGDIDGDKDFANIVAQAESIKPVPEPATMFLVGVGLIGLAGVGRKRFVK